MEIALLKGEAEKLPQDGPANAGLPFDPATARRSAKGQFRIAAGCARPPGAAKTLAVDFENLSGVALWKLLRPGTGAPR